ncbi:MAG: sigma-54 dependent transcriptional regulator [Candidatus Cloacimonetes bacterium]|nr:sigma-54 dependent transcriptional regulator [Candidatus Cloacimonadota bacterium]
MKFKSKDHRILIVDDDRYTLELLNEFLSEYYMVEQSLSGEKALEMVNSSDYQMVITDLMMPGMDGLELIGKIKDKRDDLPIFVISGSANVTTAVQAMKAGAEELILKPLTDMDLVLRLIERSLKQRWLEEENKRLVDLLEENTHIHQMQGNSEEMRRAFEIMERVAPLDMTVLLTGETGVGKSLLARIIHEHSPRREKSFVTVNCGALTESLLESTLFGHKKGSFTGAVKDQRGLFEEADGGTLFLDEISETSRAFQIKLLNAIEQQKIRKVGDDKEINVDVRMIFATNRNLKDEVEKGQFRRDLFFRINVLNIRIPALRERRGDILILASSFLLEFCHKNKLPVKRLSDDARDILQNFTWEGNIRELRNTIEYAVVMTKGEMITAGNLPSNITRGKESDDKEFDFSDLSYREAKEMFERNYFDKVLSENKGNVSLTAKQSKLARQFIYRKLEGLGLDIDEYRQNCTRSQHEL